MSPSGSVDRSSSDHLALHDRPSITTLPATKRAWSRCVLKSAGVTPNDLDLAEVHDCFTIAEVLAVEDLGLTPRGDGGRFARDGEGILNAGSTTVNASGGLKAKGHPLGATGTGQVVEVVQRLRQGRT